MERKQNVRSKGIDARKSPTWSETTSPTATISTLHTMRSCSLEPKTPTERKDSSRSRVQDDESMQDCRSVMTPSQPLHDKLDELQQKWSEKRPSLEHQSSREPHYVFAAGGRILHTSSQQQTRSKASPPTVSAGEDNNMAKKRAPTVEIIGSPDQFPLPQETRQSVFERLYHSGTASRRRRPGGRDGRTYHSMPMPATPQSSAEGTISTLSSSETVFDRLYRNEKRNRVHSPRRRAYHSDSMSASASLERRLSYQAPPLKRRNLVSSSGKVASLVQQHESRKANTRNSGTPRSDIYTSPRTPQSLDGRSMAATPDSVFDRLYRGEKRATPLLPTKPPPAWPIKPNRTLVSKSSFESSRTSHTDSIFERLHKGEKPKVSLLNERNRPADLLACSDATRPTDRIQIPPEVLGVSEKPAGTFACEDDPTKLLVYGMSHADDDSDDSLLHSELPSCDVFHVAETSTRTDNSIDGLGSLAESEVLSRFSPRELENEVKRDVRREKLARLKLHFYVRRMQRCARAYLSRVAGGKNDYTSALVECTVLRSEGQEDRAAISIQSLWRGYHRRVLTVTSMMQSCEFDCSVLSSNEYKRIQLLRIRIESLSRALARARDTRLTKVYMAEHSIRLEWSKQVIVHFEHEGLSRMESVVVALKCSMVSFSFLKSWTSQRLSVLVVKAGLSKAYKTESEKLLSASLSVIQSWARIVLRKLRSSRNRGRVCPIRTSGLPYLAQYLTPTSLQQKSSITLQSAWRFHQSQIRAADAMVTSWRISCDAEDKAPKNRILGLRVGLCALSKAIGRVDCWWITENVVVGDCLVSVKWKREVGVHFTHRSIPKLETCTVGLDCRARRSVFVERWGGRKAAILIVKAVLNRAIDRDASFLLNESATLIQTRFRMNRLRLEYLCKVRACRTIQKTFRSFHHRSVGQRNEWSHCNAISTFNKRGARQLRGVASVDSIFAQEIYAATTIQKKARNFLVACRMQSRDRSARAIQSFLRRQRARRYNEAASLVQAFMRSLHHRRSTERTNRSAKTIQTCWRAASVRDSFAELRRSAIVIQTLERRRRCIFHFVAMREASVASKIQSRYRGARLRRQLAIEAMSAAVIQSTYRRHRARSVFETFRVGVLKLQAVHRGNSTRRLVSLWRTLVARSRLALLVQKGWRGFQGRREVVQRRSAVRKQNQAAIMIQSCYRCFELRSDFLTLRQTAIDVQTFERRRRAMLNYQRALFGCLRLQALFRGVQARRLEMTRVSSVVLVQAVWRGSRGRKHFAKFRNSTILLQSMCRRQNALNLQSTWRTEAAKIQRWYRCFEVRRNFWALREAAIDIQTSERRRISMLKFQRIVAACIRVQAICRGAHARRMRKLRMASAVNVQAAWRGLRSQRQFATLRNSIIVVQSLQRRRMVMDLFQERVARILILQALFRGVVVRRDYSKLLNSAIIAQAAWRGKRDRQLALEKIVRRNEELTIANGIEAFQRVFRARRHRRETSTVLIQSRYRQYSICKSFNKLKQSAIRIQAEQRRRQSLMKYSRLIDAAIRLQGLLRIRMARQLSARRAHIVRLAACLIQRCWRRHCLRQNFLTLKLFAIQIQAVERRRRSRLSYLHAMHGTIRLQARLRGVMTRQMLSQLIKAAVAVQRWFRGRIVRLTFETLKQFAVQIQVAERRRQSLSRFSLIRNGILRLQACCRGFLVRRRLAEQAQTIQDAAVLIQNHWRRYFLRLSFLSLRRAVVTIQRVERRRFSLSKYTRILVGIVYLQASYRGCQTRQLLVRCAEMHERASIHIQSCWRRFSVRRKFLATMKMALRLQAAARRRTCQLEYGIVRDGVLSLQALFRGFFERKLLTELAAAVIIQSWCRSIVPRQKFLLSRDAAVLIQTIQRRRTSQLRYTRVKRGIILFQTCFRGLLVRNQLELRVVAARRVQAFWRAAFASKRLFVFRAGVLSLQSGFRCRRAERMLRRSLNGVVLLQAVQRGVSTRRYLLEQRQATLTIQKEWERHVLRRCELSTSQSNLMDDKPKMSSDPVFLAASVIQSRMRSFMAKRALEEMQVSARLIQVKYFSWKMQIAVLMVQSSVVLLQRSVRAQLLRSAARFALSHINASLRSPVVGSFKRVTTADDPGVDSVWREWTMAVNLAREAACIVIQSAVRRMLAIQYRDKVRMDPPTVRQFVSRNVASAFNSIKTISSSVSAEGQKTSNCTNERITDSAATEITTDEPFEEVNGVAIETNRSESATVIQQMVRRRRARQKVRENIAASRLQKALRRRLAMTMYTRCIFGVVCLQSRFRGARMRSDMATKTRSCILLQSTWRAFRERERHQAAKAVLVIQSFCRMRSAFWYFNAQRDAAMVIQRRFRDYQQGNVVRTNVSLQKVASVRLQRVWRRHYECERFLHRRKMAVLIQATYRRHCASRVFCSLKESTLALQATYRGLRRRREYLDQRAAAIKLQANVRQFVAQKTWLTALSSVTSIQRIWRRAAVRQKGAINVTSSVSGDTRDVILDRRASAATDESHVAPKVRRVDCTQALDRTRRSIVSLVDNKSKSELKRLLEGDAASLGCAGICIGRLASHVVDAQNKARTLENNVSKREDSIATFRSPPNNQETECLRVDTESEPDDEQHVLEASHDAIDSSRVCDGATESQVMTTSDGQEEVECSNVVESNGGDVVDLAAQAQQLLVEARRARAQFQMSRTPSRVDSKAPSETQPVLASHERMNNSKPSGMFGKDIQEEDLPSPIRAGEDEWEWTNDWM